LSNAADQPLAWITGAAGLLGHYLVQTAPRFAPGWRVRGFSRAELDLVDFPAVRRAFDEQRPALVLHCAAMSKTAEAQAHPALARRINVEATAHLAELAAEVPFVFFSTDLVFDGRRGHYVETDPVSPVNVYGETKAAAEQIVLRHPRALVLRLSINAGISPTGDRAFNEQIRRAWERGETLRFFTDEFRCPIPAVVTAQVVWELVQRSVTGLYHVAGSERLSRHQIGELLAARWPHLQPRYEAMSLRDFCGGPRPPDVSMDCTKVQALLSFRLPAFSQWLREHPDEPL
jgi:dTDP-4-dehydrorhamnose reductase